jgi:hypothetical protein
VTITEFPLSSASTTVHPRLLELLETDTLDWDYLPHREMYLRAWVKGNIPRFGR